MKKEISLSRLKELLSYDPVTGIFSKKGIIGDKGYVLIYLDGKYFAAHRLAWLFVYGVFPQGQIDHFDGNRANNRIKNLRDGTVSVNQQNLKKAKSSNKSTGVLGVSFNGKIFQAKIQISKKQIHLGNFGNLIDAKEAYIRAKRELHPGGTL